MTNKRKASEAGPSQKLKAAVEEPDVDARCGPEPLIDPEFESLIPPPSAEELASLEAQMLADGGCRDPLVVWAGENILLDGHNRLAICKKHNLTYTIAEREFLSREAVIEWIVANQMGRRNLHPEAASYFRGKRYLAEVQRAVQSGEESPKAARKRVAELLAQECKLDAKTIRRDGEFVATMDEFVRNHGDEVRQKVLSRRVLLKQAELNRLADKPLSVQKRLVAQLLADGKLKKPSAPKPSAADSLTRAWLKVKEADRQMAIECLLADEDFAALMKKAKKASGSPSRSDEDE